MLTAGGVLSGDTTLTFLCTALPVWIGDDLSVARASMVAGPLHFVASGVYIVGLYPAPLFEITDDVSRVLCA